LSRGVFIVFEGPDGCGKTTLAASCARVLVALGCDVLSVREPGGTTLGERVREILLSSSENLSTASETFLFMAARAQLVEKVIVPALEQGKIVVCDRFLWSTAAYQGGAMGLGIDGVLEMGRVATGGLEPDLYVVVLVSPETARARQKGRLDRIESRGIGFQAAVLAAYRELAERFPDRAVVVDGSGSMDEVLETTWQEVRRVLDSRSRA
jgi:dTMP kinase